MDLQYLKEYIERYPDGTEFVCWLSEPFSWRGSYDEVAFSIAEEKMTKEEVLRRVSMAYSYSFHWYKWGDYYYNDTTEVHFEDSWWSYSDGMYTDALISKIEWSTLYASQDHKLVNLALTPVGKSEKSLEKD